MSNGGSPSVVQNVLILVFDILLIEPFWGLGAFDLIFDLQMLPHTVIRFDQNPQASKKKKKRIPQHKVFFHIFLTS